MTDWMRIGGMPPSRIFTGLLIGLAIEAVFGLFAYLGYRVITYHN